MGQWRSIAVVGWASGGRITSPLVLERKSECKQNFDVTYFPDPGCQGLETWMPECFWSDRDNYVPFFWCGCCLSRPFYWVSSSDLQYLLSVFHWKPGNVFWILIFRFLSILDRFFVFVYILPSAVGTRSALDMVLMLVFYWYWVSCWWIKSRILKYFDVQVFYF